MNNVKKLYKKYLLESLINDTDKWFYEKEYIWTDTFTYYVIKYPNFTIRISSWIKIVEVTYVDLIENNKKSVNFYCFFNFWINPKLYYSYIKMKKMVHKKINEKQIENFYLIVKNNRKDKINKILKNIKNAK